MIILVLIMMILIMMIIIGNVAAAKELVLGGRGKPMRRVM